MTMSIVDTRGFSKQESRSQLNLYIVLMVLSCAIGIANGYIANMPSPADAIEKIVIAIIGK